MVACYHKRSNSTVVMKLTQCRVRFPETPCYPVISKTPIGKILINVRINIITKNNYMFIFDITFVYNAPFLKFYVMIYRYYCDNYRYF